MSKSMTLMMLLLAASNMGYGQEWTLKKENDHLKIYTAALENSAYKTVKVECTVSGRFQQVIAALLDVEHQKDWVFNTKSARLIKWTSSNELAYYSEVSLPWPFTNRDFIAHLKITQPTDNTVVITSFADPDVLPLKKGIIRIKTSSSQWAMTDIGNNKLKINYVIQFDPAGDVPGWLINMFITKGPYETFEHLQARIDMPEYRNAHYDFIKETSISSKRN